MASIIGTHFRVGRNAWNPVDRARVGRIMSVVVTLRK
jgi:predicted TIM-barrel enzyme